MIREIKYFFESRRAVRAGKKTVSPEQAVKDYEKYRSAGLSGSYKQGAIRSGKAHHVLLDGEVYTLTHDGRSRSAYFLPETSTLESADGKKRRFEGNYLPGKEFYQ
ncbi:MAG TPA: hypothetical protein VN711_03595 [Candidatus Saccharimonadales bacterium]|nr:hypothetical protein [Candidatus Saccharimonadales bacterium]